MKSPKGNVSESGQSIIELAIVLVLVVVIILVVIFLIAPILIGAKCDRNFGTQEFSIKIGFNCLIFIYLYV